MMSGTPDLDTRLLTIEEFARLPDDGWRHELVEGRVIREPYSGFQQGATAVNVGYVLHEFARPRGLGRVVLGTGFVLWDAPPTVRGPDAAFVLQSRLDFDHSGFAPFAPDLTVEVLAPWNTMSEIHNKVLDYLDAGSQLVWVVDPELRTVTVYRSRREIQLLAEDDEIDGADVLPGFRRRVAELFDS